MNKPLSNMTNDELWALFPVILREYNPEWPLWYEAEKRVIADAVGAENIVRVNHFGSTSVPGLTAKPTVDILLEIDRDTDIEVLTRALEDAGYRTSPQPGNPPPHLLFMKGYTQNGFTDKVFHLHVRYSGDWHELYFRDWLREHPETAKEYGNLKLRLQETFMHNRDGYTEAKDEFIKKVTEQARMRYKGRYEVKEAKS